MKKMIMLLMVLLITMPMLPLVGCNKTNSNVGENIESNATSNDSKFQQELNDLKDKFAIIETERDDLKKQLQDKETEISELVKQISNLEEELNSIRNPVETAEPTETPKPDTGEKIVSLNETFEVGDVMEITLLSSKWSDKILPSNTSGAYSYYNDIDGEKFFVVKGSIKSKASEPFEIDYASSCELLVNGKYKVPACMKTEAADGKSFYGSIKPLQTLKLIVYGSMSDDMCDTCETIELIMKICNTDEMLTQYFYDDDTPHDTFVISFSN